MKRTSKRIRRYAARFMVCNTPSRTRDMIHRMRRVGLTWGQIKQCMGLTRAVTTIQA